MSNEPDDLIEGLRILARQPHLSAHESRAFEQAADLLEAYKAALQGVLHEANWMLDLVDINVAAKAAIRERLVRARTLIKQDGGR